MADNETVERVIERAARKMSRTGIVVLIDARIACRIAVASVLDEVRREFPARQAPLTAMIDVNEVHDVLDAIARDWGLP